MNARAIHQRGAYYGEIHHRVYAREEKRIYRERSKLYNNLRAEGVIAEERNRRCQELQNQLWQDFNARQQRQEDERKARQRWAERERMRKQEELKERLRTEVRKEQKDELALLKKTIEEQCVTIKSCQQAVLEKDTEIADLHNYVETLKTRLLAEEAFERDLGSGFESDQEEDVREVIIGEDIADDLDQRLQEERREYDELEGAKQEGLKVCLRRANYHPA